MSAGGWRPFSSSYSRLGWGGGAVASFGPHAPTVGARIAKRSPTVDTTLRGVMHLRRSLTRLGPHSPLSIDGSVAAQASEISGLG